MSNISGGKRRDSAQSTHGESATGERDAAKEPLDVSLSGDPKEAPDDRADHGPFDVSETVKSRPYVDLGALKIPPRQNLVLKVQVQEHTQRIMAVSLELDGVQLLLQPYAAPKSSGLWAGVRDQLRESLAQQHAEVEEVRGALGRELRARSVVDGKTSEIRFLGVDGPRWFLRGVISGVPFSDGERHASAERLFREVAVDRGTEPLPPRDLLPLHVPVAPEQDA